MKTDLFDFELPQELIAQVPAQQRSGSRLLVYNRATDVVEHKKFSDICDLFAEGDLLVLNSSRVIPARMFTIDSEYGKAGYEVLFVKQLENGNFTAMVQPGRRFKVGRIHLMPGNNRVEVLKVLPTGLRELRFLDNDDPVAVFRKYGQMPLPPYITSRESEPERYQTVYSEQEGSIAAPTAGLHFDDRIFSELKKRGVKIAHIVLHVGLGTFKPVESENIYDHKMHEEVFYISKQTAEIFAETRAKGSRIFSD
jgi:S-adenosylmethionine:tRNA ribosyltransferase-isomerase